MNSLLLRLFPLDIVRWYITPYFNVEDLAYQWFASTEPRDADMWLSLFYHYYSTAYALRVDPELVVERALGEAPQDRDLLIISLMSGYHTNTHLTKLFASPMVEQFNDLTLALYFKVHLNQYMLERVLYQYWHLCIKYRYYMALHYLVTQTSVTITSEFNLLWLVYYEETNISEISIHYGRLILAMVN